MVGFNYSSTSSLAVRRAAAVVPSTILIISLLLCTILFAQETVANKHHDDTDGNNNGGGGSTRNIVRKAEESAIVVSSSSSSYASSASSSSTTRSLIEMNSMVCEMSDNNDGSILCEFRVVPNNILASEEKNVYEDCAPLSGSNSKLCVSTTIYVRTEPAPTDQPTTPAPVPQPTPPPTDAAAADIVIVPATVVPLSLTSSPLQNCEKMRCPRFKPTSGSHCRGWLLPETTFGCCEFDLDYTITTTKTKTTCSCDLNKGYDDVVTGYFNNRNVLWDCDDDLSTIDDGSSSVINNNGGIDFDPNSGFLPTTPKTPPPPPTNSPVKTLEINVPKPINKPECPLTLADAERSSCSKVLPVRCGYWDDENNPTKIIDCRCKMYDGTFQCDDAPIELYYSF